MIPGEESENGVTIPVELNEPITIETADDTDLSIELPIAEGAVAETTAAGDVVVPSTNEGADLLIQEIATEEIEDFSAGVRTIITIDNWDVDPLFSFTPEIPEGGYIEADTSGAVVIYTENDEVSSVIGDPWAFDAEGTKVPTWYEIEVGTVYQYVDHISAEFVYPVVADPVWFIPLVLRGGALVVKRLVASTVAAARAAAVKQNSGSSVAKMKSYTKANYRHNLVVHTLRQPGKRCDAHHTLPQAFRPDFMRIGFKGDDSIDHPKYLLWWESSDHRKKASQYNNDWRTWLKNNPRATKVSTLNYRTAVIRKYKPWC